MISEEPKLKPCPFCGGKAHLRDESSIYRIRCERCDAKIARYTSWDAVRDWNLRLDVDESCKEENATCKKNLQLTRSDIEQMVKPLQWEDLEKRTTYENGFTEVYRSAESNLFFGMLKFRIFKCHNEFKELRLLDCFKGQSISIQSGNYSLEEAKQHAQTWLVDLICSALRVEE